MEYKPSKTNQHTPDTLQLRIALHKYYILPKQQGEYGQRIDMNVAETIVFAVLLSSIDNTAQILYFSRQQQGMDSQVFPMWQRPWNWSLDKSRRSQRVLTRPAYSLRGHCQWPQGQPDKIPPAERFRIFRLGIVAFKKERDRINGLAAKGRGEEQTVASLSLIQDPFIPTLVNGSRAWRFDLTLARNSASLFLARPRQAAGSEPSKPTQ